MTKNVAAGCQPLLDNRQQVLSVTLPSRPPLLDADPLRLEQAIMARSRGGLSLGLTMTRQLIELHGGAVEAQSGGPGRGSEFIVTLPLRKALAAHDSGRCAGGLPADPSASSRRILIIEDDHDTADMLRDLLEDMGHRVASSSCPRSSPGATCGPAPDGWATGISAATH